MTENKELELAWEFVNSTNRSVFLTGKAGTGKTTFLHRLKMNSNKRMVVVAPTGVAAINAKGVTIHSFFQMPFGPILPDADLNKVSGFNRKFNKTKINIIKSMDLLVIDEISMVRADLLDGIDKTLRQYRNRNKVFGGVQVLMIGDLQQLSPVVKENEWDLLKHYYDNAFFFSSHAFKACHALTIELKHIYRQENPKFIEILNEIRNNALSEGGSEELNKRYKPDFNPEPGYIFLTTHNRRAEAINNKELNKLEGKTVTYKAKVEGKFPEYAYPNSDNLELKVGAQVMFIKNDSNPEKRYFNGKIGKVIHLDRDEVVVHCPDDEFNIITKPEIWESIDYKVDSETKEITEERKGAYTQIPLRLAWSITIHKSQGLTFENAIIDAEAAFAHGQTYVALSRCKSLEGLVLKSKISPNQIINDSHVLAFNANTEVYKPDESILNESRKTFQLDLISEVFEFYEFLHPVNRVLDIFYKSRNILEGSIEAPMLVIKESITNLLKVSNAFKVQLKEIALLDDVLPEENKQLQERYKKAIAYFKSELETHVVTSLKSFSFTTDNKAIQSDLTKHLDKLEELLDTKQLYFNNLPIEFRTQEFLELRVKAVFELKSKTKKKRKDVIDGTTNIELFEKLRILRNEIAQENDLIHYQVFTQKALYEMCEVLPVNKRDLKSINGMGKVRIEKYGQAIIDCILEYCEDNDIEVFQPEEAIIEENQKRQKGDTKKQSLELFKKGHSIEQIAEIRALNENTIFGHLANFIPTGEVQVTDLIGEQEYTELKEIIPKKTFGNLSELKLQLDDKYSYATIRLVLGTLKTD
ncbi:helix-turn-helix domain-containing protein [Gaetbulibacter saemankumensis]|uniref:helix-turn-helix domain-containing protein n=1 Tax=Gaetbulibacter saemankumensis TaxID=311208 RepID=UPI00041864D5|nr:helix-turn-helix domain-containing protein [Gaetbulibacter saemankumensis]